MRWPWVVMLVGLAGVAGSAWSQRGPYQLSPIPLESLGPNSFDVRSFDGLARRTGPQSPDTRLDERLPPVAGSAGYRERQDSLSYQFGAPRPGRNAEGYLGSTPYWGSPLPSFATQPQGSMTGGPFLPQFPLILPEFLPPPPGGMAAEREPSRVRRPMFSQGWTLDGFGSSR